jgi:hypothetical protein
VATVLVLTELFTQVELAALVHLPRVQVAAAQVLRATVLMLQEQQAVQVA